MKPCWWCGADAVVITHGMQPVCSRPPPVAFAHCLTDACGCGLSGPKIWRDEKRNETAEQLRARAEAAWDQGPRNVLTPEQAAAVRALYLAADEVLYGLDLDETRMSDALDAARTLGLNRLGEEP